MTAPPRRWIVARFFYAFSTMLVLHKSASVVSALSTALASSFQQIDKKNLLDRGKIGGDPVEASECCVVLRFHRNCCIATIRRHLALLLGTRLVHDTTTRKADDASTLSCQLPDASYAANSSLYRLLYRYYSSLLWIARLALAPRVPVPVYLTTGPTTLIPLPSLHPATIGTRTASKDVKNSKKRRACETFRPVVSRYRTTGVSFLPFLKDPPLTRHQSFSCLLAPLVPCLLMDMECGSDYITSAFSSLYLVDAI